MRLSMPSLSDNTTTAALCTLSALTGALGWSGKPELNFLGLLYPFVYLHSRRRLDTLSAVFYFAGAAWPVIPGAQSFFQTGNNLLHPLLIWAVMSLLGGLPWVLFYSRRLLSLSALAALAALALPPLSLVTVAHPLVAAGRWFPGTHWFGLALPLVLIATHKRLGASYVFAVLILASLVVHFRFERPSSDPRIVPIHTAFGGTSAQKNDGTRLQKIENAIEEAALTHPNALVIFPEMVVPDWSAAHEARWARTFAQLRSQHTGVLLGTSIPVQNTKANRNVLLARGYSERLSYVQRVPIPLGMWQVGESYRGFPLALRFPAAIRVWNHQAGVLLCYEQITFWPALETMARNPEILIAPSNLYWARNSSIPAIEHIASQDWADLWAIPLYEARNQ